MYLNGDYQKLLNGEEEGPDHTKDEIADISQDPEQMMKQGQDVDEWLLSGLSENCSLAASKQPTQCLPQENEDNIIMKKIEENQIKQAQAHVEKTYIIDDIDEELAIPLKSEQSEKIYNRRVTTVEEQQTWEDMEDEYDNEKNILEQYERMKNSSSNSQEDHSLQSFRQNSHEDDSQQLYSSEFVVDGVGAAGGSGDENLSDEDEELVSSVVSFHQSDSNQAQESSRSIVSIVSPPTAQINLYSPESGEIHTQKNIEEEGACWMYKTFDTNFKQIPGPGLKLS